MCLTRYYMQITVHFYVLGDVSNTDSSSRHSDSGRCYKPTCSLRHQHSVAFAVSDRWLQRIPLLTAPRDKYLGMVFSTYERAVLKAASLNRNWQAKQRKVEPPSLGLELDVACVVHQRQ